MAKTTSTYKAEAIELRIQDYVPFEPLLGFVTEAEASTPVILNDSIVTEFVIDVSESQIILDR